MATRSTPSVWCGNVRRISLTGLLAVFPTRSRVFVAVLLSQFFFALQMKLMPFAIQHDNDLQNIANAGITLSLTLLLACQANATKDAVLGGIAAVAVLMILPAVILRQRAYMRDRRVLLASTLCASLATARYSEGDQLSTQDIYVSLCGPTTLPALLYIFHRQ